MAGQAELEQAVALARAGSLPPLVLVCGDQDYLVRQAYDRLLEALVPEERRAFNLERLDGTRAEARAVLDALATPSMLGGLKAVGVEDARYFQSKTSLAEVLGKAREQWAAGQASPALRQLGRACALAGWGWQEAAQASAEDWAEALGPQGNAGTLLAGGWIKAALEQALRSGLEAPAQGDEAGALEEGLRRLLDGGLSEAALVCACGGADQRKRLFKLFHERGRVLEFKADAKSAQALMTARAFLQQALKNRGLSMKPRLAEKLAASYGRELGPLEREVEKLQALAYPRTEISEEDFAAAVLPPPEEEVFALIDALSAKDLPRALRLLRRFLGEGRDMPFRILNLLGASVRKMLLLRALQDEGRIPERARNLDAFRAELHPRLGRELPPALAAAWRRSNYWVMHQTLQRSAAFKPAELRALLRALADTDLRLKTGGDEVRLLEELALRFCGVKEEVLL